MSGEPETHTLCPHCAESILSVSRKCRHCGEYVDPADPERERVSLGPGLTAAAGVGLGLLSLLVLVTTVVGAVAYPSVLEAERKQRLKGAAASLEALAEAQASYQAANGRYGELAELAQADLLDPLLASGLKDGFVFEVVVSQLAPGERWMAVTTAVKPQARRSMHLAINQGGQVYFRPNRPIELDPQHCSLPPDCFPFSDDAY